jgi:hypothetical protein
MEEAQKVSAATALEEIRERDKLAWGRDGALMELGAILKGKDDVPHLLAAVEAALKQHEEFDGTCSGCTDAYGDPAAWPCEEYRAITVALTRQDDR